MRTKLLCFFALFFLTSHIMSQTIPQSTWQGEDPRAQMDNPAGIQTRWEWLSPLPQGNTLRDIYVADSSTIYAVGDVGTIIKTTDSGDHWLVTHFLGGEIASFQSISFYGDVYGVIVGGHGSILRTSDGGGTWIRSNSGATAELRSVYCASQSLCLAVGDSGTILRSSDRGISWATIPAVTNGNLRDVSFGNGHVGIVVGDNGIFRTSDAGVSWECRDSLKHGTSVAFADSNVVICTGGGYFVWRSANGGQTWYDAFTSSGEFYDRVAFSNSIDGVITGVINGHQYGLLTYARKTSDGGQTWVVSGYSFVGRIPIRAIGLRLPDSLVYVGDFGLIGGVGVDNNSAGILWRGLRSVSFADPQRGLAIGPPEPYPPVYSSKVVLTTDGGNRWRNITLDSTTYLNDVAWLGANTGFAVGYRPGTGVIVGTSDGGLAWHSVFQGTGGWSAIAFNSQASGVAVGGSIAGTSNAGVTWDIRTSIVPHGLYGVAYADSDLVVAVGGLGSILRSTNGGENWDSIASGTTAQLSGVSFANQYLGTIVGHDGLILGTTDGGLTWSTRVSGTVDNINSVIFVNSGLGILVGDGGTTMISTDGGYNWVRMSAPTYNNIFDVHFVKSGSGYVGYAVGDGGGILVSAISPLNSRTWSWNGVTDSSWFTPNNWTPVGLPLPGDSVIIGPAPRRPIIDSVRQQVVIGSLYIESGGWLTITSALSRFVVLSDVTVRGTLQLRPPAATSIVVGGNWTIDPGSSDSGFVPATSTVYFTGNGTFGRNFYNLTIDTSSAMGSNHSIVVENQAAFLRDTTHLRREDTLSFQLGLPQAFAGSGIIPRGTITSVVQQGVTGAYRFESESTYVRFRSTGVHPTVVSMTAYPDTNPLDFGSRWIQTGGTVNPLRHTIRIDTVQTGLSRRWVIRLPRPFDSPNKTSVDSIFIQRVYTLSCDSNAIATLSFRYDPREMPGGVAEDSLQLYYSDTPTASVGIAQGWNMISNPVSNPVPDDSAKHLFPSLISRVFRFNAGYVPGDVMENGVGYWGKFPDAEVNPIFGVPLTRDSIDVVTGWNMTGSITNPVDTSTIASVPPGLRASNWFGYSSGYYSVAQILPGKAYWVKANGMGRFVLASPLFGSVFKLQSSKFGALDALHSLTLTDSRNGKQTLYFGSDEKNEIPVTMFGMPPAPPVGSFDARFETPDGGVMVQTHSALETKLIEFPIAIQSDAYPLTISWQINGGSSLYELEDDHGGKTFPPKKMNGEGSIKITDSKVTRVIVKLVGNAQLPTEFTLSQNYPNPFNPTTIIKYGLPVDSKITLDIYNILGQRVKTLLNGDQPAGYHSIEWNGVGNGGQQLASGVYFYKLAAVGSGNSSSTFVRINKMLLLK